MSPAAQPGPLVSIDWLSPHLGDADLRLVHVGLDRKGYDHGHIPGAIFSDLHVDLAKPGTRLDTGEAKRQYIVPTAQETTEALSRWGVKEGDRIVFYDDVGQGRWAIRGYWLLRLHGYPAGRFHVLDGGLSAWTVSGGVTTREEPAVKATFTRGFLTKGDASVRATAKQVLEWSGEASAPGGPTRILDVRSIDEYLGSDVRAARGGRIPGAKHRLFSDFEAADGRIRPAADVLTILRANGVNPAELRAVYCQGGIRAALVWFALSEIAGLTEVRNYAESWEEWGNRPKLPVEK